ncbi:MAG: nodulation protein NfeD [Chloroflexi bacterium]|nr:nodulation protein NfeD [Chloroflexota bacterium]
MVKQTWRAILIGLTLAAWAGGAASASNGQVLVLSVDGPITQAVDVYVERGIGEAERRNAEAVIVELNTPGGQIDVMEKIVAAIRASDTPVIVFVTPRGALAGSAGAVITLAGHAAAMSPETAIGAASPVGSGGEDLNQTLDQKIKEALSATARSLTERRGEKAMELATAMIQSAKAVSVSEAREAGLIDFVAEDTAALLPQLDGFEVIVRDQPRKLRTAGAAPIEFPMSLIERFLHVLTNPNLISILLLVGAQSILIELSSPGGWVAGFVGAVCLALAFYGMSVLPVNWFGLAFIAIAFVLFLLDIKAPTHGALTLAAAASLIVGTLVLFNSPGTPAFERVSVPLVVVTSLITAALFFVVVMLAVRAQKRPVTTGVQTLVGQIGEVRAALTPSGQIQVAGELWSAESDGEPIEAGKKVQVVEVRGLRLRVKRKQ